MFDVQSACGSICVQLLLLATGPAPVDAEREPNERLTFDRG